MSAIHAEFLEKLLIEARAKIVKLEREKEFVEVQNGMFTDEIKDLNKRIDQLKPKHRYLESALFYASLTDDELLKHVDRSTSDVLELAERLESALFHADNLKLEIVQLRKHLDHYMGV